MKITINIWLEEEQKDQLKEILSPFKYCVIPIISERNPGIAVRIKQEVRNEKILSVLKKYGEMSTQNIHSKIKETGISYRTISRDLTKLCIDNKIDSRRCREGSTQKNYYRLKGV